MTPSYPASKLPLLLQPFVGFALRSSAGRDTLLAQILAFLRGFVSFFFIYLGTRFVRVIVWVIGFHALRFV